MSGPNSLSNITSTPTYPAMASAVPAAGAPNSTNPAFDPRDIQIDPSKFRIGGFVGDPSATPTAGGIALGDVDLLATAVPQATNSDLADVDANEGGPVATDSTAEATDDPKTEQEQAREQREARFRELVQSGKLGKAQNERPGKRFTLPVEKPKLM